MTDEQKRIRAYLQAQAAKLSPAQIVDKVRAAMTELRAAAVAVPAARFAERPAPEEWSANEVMAHVVEAGRHFGGAVVRLLDVQAHKLSSDPELVEGGQLLALFVDPRIGASGHDPDGDHDGDDHDDDDRGDDRSGHGGDGRR